MKIAVESRFKQAGVFVCHGAPYYATLVMLVQASTIHPKCYTKSGIENGIWRIVYRKRYMENGTTRSGTPSGT